MTLIDLITSPDAATRDLSLDEQIAGLSLTELLAECEALETFRRQADNLYERVRALFFSRRFIGIISIVVQAPRLQ